MVAGPVQTVVVLVPVAGSKSKFARAELSRCSFCHCAEPIAGKAQRWAFAEGEGPELADIVH